MKHANKQTISLQRIDIASPCTASWDEMKGDQRVRHCDDCNKSVFNLSDMPEADAARLLADNHSGELCVRFYQRQDGTVITGDCGDSQRAMVRQAWRRPAPAAVELPEMRVTMGAPPASCEPYVAAEPAGQAIGQSSVPKPNGVLIGRVLAPDQDKTAGKRAQGADGAGDAGTPARPAK
ncbi:hypothetical protein F2P45_31315 [Massilia sp. CCM 8733]|uniref:Uncharacterized protein n=1 Tax=Massilia mucilaginosa TaxID=2609282 RepID=A0ABX0P2I9_9BURK|nr:hypothetical protein [Massilia mucilaginosa]NHZ93460.1 hypothetical protein [Massilia mucilaginosa]